MDNFLLNNWNGYNFGKSLNDIANYNGRDGWHTNDSYFFLERELEFKNKTQWASAKNNNLIRHVKPYNGKWLDYVVHEEFNTLAEWVADCGDSYANVLYGVNRVHLGQQPKFVCLAHFLEALGYVKPSIQDDTFTRVLERLGQTKALSDKGARCLVKRSDGTIVIARVIDKQLESLESSNGEPNIVISIPIDNLGNMMECSRLSHVTRGTEIYFKTTDGEFCSMNDLL
jgi:hypothetical protein